MLKSTMGGFVLTQPPAELPPGLVDLYGDNRETVLVCSSPGQPLLDGFALLTTAQAAWAQQESHNQPVGYVELTPRDPQSIHSAAYFAEGELADFVHDQDLSAETLASVPAFEAVERKFVADPASSIVASIFLLTGPDLVGALPYLPPTERNHSIARVFWQLHEGGPIEVGQTEKWRVKPADHSVFAIVDVEASFIGQFPADGTGIDGTVVAIGHRELGQLRSIEMRSSTHYVFTTMSGDVYETDNQDWALAVPSVVLPEGAAEPLHFGCIVEIQLT